MKMCETPCTIIETCNLNDKIRAEKQKEANKNLGSRYEIEKYGLTPQGKEWEV